MAAEKKKPMTAEAKRDSKRLKDFIGSQKLKGERIYITQLAQIYGCNRSLPGQYVNGNIPLNDTWKLRFAKHLGVAPQQIWPDWMHKDVTPGGMPADVAAAAERMSNMPADKRAPLVSLILSMPTEGSSK